MLVLDADILRMARLMLRQHGTAAAVCRALKMANEPLDSGNPYSAGIWRRITKAIEDLIAVEARRQSAPSLGLDQCGQNRGNP